MQSTFISFTDIPLFDPQLICKLVPVQHQQYENGLRTNQFNYIYTALAFKKIKLNKCNLF